MASIVPNLKNESLVARRVYVSVNGKRQPIRLPKLDGDDARAAKKAIEDLANSIQRNREPKRATREWMEELDDTVHQRLADAGLIDPRHAMPLGQFIDDYVAARNDLQESTRKKNASTFKSLRRFFGNSKLLRDITCGDAEDWRRQLGTENGP